MHTCEYTSDGADPGVVNPACGKPATIMNPKSFVDFDYEEWFCAEHADPAWSAIADTATLTRETDRGTEYLIPEPPAPVSRLQQPHWSKQSTSTRITVDVPYYVHPEAVELGRVVRDMEDPKETRLVVVRIEPALICVDPEGEERMVLAHMVEVIE